MKPLPRPLNTRLLPERAARLAVSFSRMRYTATLGVLLSACATGPGVDAAAGHAASAATPTGAAAGAGAGAGAGAAAPAANRCAALSAEIADTQAAVQTATERKSNAWKLVVPFAVLARHAQAGNELDKAEQQLADLRTQATRAGCPR
jgi:hypothetical protein